MQASHYDGETVRGRTLMGEQFGVRVGGWKYIGGSDDKTLEFYNLRADPTERRNLYGKKPGKGRRLAA